jgi:predicted kinase
MKLGTLIIFSGLPGSGKSSLAMRLASRFGATYLRIDTIEQGLRDDCGLIEIDGKGYRLTYRIAQENLRLGNDVIADSVNPWELTRKEWNNVAEEIGAAFINLEIVCSDKEEHRRRVEGRNSSMPGIKLPTWEDVMMRDYRPWGAPRLQLDTSKKSIDQCFEDLLSSLRSTGYLER